MKKHHQRGSINWYMGNLQYFDSFVLLGARSPVEAGQLGKPSASFGVGRPSPHRDENYFINAAHNIIPMGPTA